MDQKASKKAIKQLQQVFDVLGKYGGTIETKDPGSWWKLDLEVESIERNSRDIMIGVCKDMNGDILFDPQFLLTVITDGDEIIDAFVKECINETILGTTVVGPDNIIKFFGWGGSYSEKSDRTLSELFDEYMRNMAEVGPYLKDPKAIKKYNHALSD